MPHDHLCESRQDVGEFCIECGQIATVREDERLRSIEIVRAVAPDDPTRARIIEALEPPGDWIGMLRLADE